MCKRIYPPAGESPTREFLVEVRGGNGVGQLSGVISVNPGTGYGRSPCKPAEERVTCTAVDEGNLRLFPEMTTLEGTTYSRVTLDTPVGMLIDLSAPGCLTFPEASEPPCPNPPPYTAEQLAEVAVAIARANIK